MPFTNALSFILITACHRSVIQRPQALTGDVESSANCRVVQHTLGETCIPIHPQRIVVLDNMFLLDSVLALGINPVGIVPCSFCIPSDTLSQLVGDIPIVGHNENPPIEKILSLKPDLILGFRGQKTSYSLLSTIAPTVMIENIETSRGFKEELKHLAEILDRKDEVERILTEYNRRVQEFRQQLGEKLKTKLVSVLYIHTFLFGVYRPEFTIYGQIMNDVGIQFLPAYKHLKKDVYTTLSIETLPEWDADFVFILLTYKTHPEDFEMMLKKPIWSALKAVQNKRVYAVKWSSTVVGPITAIQFLDDLEKYLVKQVD